MINNQQPMSNDVTGEDPQEGKDIPSYFVEIAELRGLIEYGTIKCYDDATPGKNTIDLYKYWKKLTQSNEQKGKYLGLHITQSGDVKASHFIGAIWFDEEEGIPVIVKPKIKHVDYLSMLTIVLAGNHLCPVREFLQYELDKPLIDAENSLPDMTILQVIIFLRLLNEFCRRDLKRSHVAYEENLTGKIKGKIIVTQNTRRNTCRGRMDRVYCRYQTFDMDNLYNQILKRALWLCFRIISGRASLEPVLGVWARQCDAALSQVSLKNITLRDFDSCRYHGFNKRYKELHGLARMIILNKKVYPDSENENTGNKMVPFYLNMNFLFEKYVGIILKKMKLEIICSNKDIDVQEKNENVKYKTKITIRPDYIGKYKGLPEGKQGLVVDAKYKVFFEGNEEKEVGSNWYMDEHDNDVEINIERFNKPIQKSDLYQILSYPLLLKKSNQFRDMGFDSSILAFPVTPGNINSEFKYDQLFSEKFFDTEDFTMLTILLETNSSLKVKCLPCILPVLKEK